MAFGVEAGGGFSHFAGGGVIYFATLAEVVQGGAAAGGDGQTEGFAVGLGFVGADIEIVQRGRFSGPMDIDAGGEGVVLAQLVLFLLDE